MNLPTYQYLRAYAWPNHEDRRERASHFFSTVVRCLHELKLPYRKGFCLCYDRTTADRPGAMGDPLVIGLLERHGRKSDRFKDDGDEDKFLHGELASFFRALNLEYQTLSSPGGPAGLDVDQLAGWARGRFEVLDCVVCSDGKSVERAESVVIEAESIEAARSRANAQMPARSRISKEEVLASPQAVRAAFPAFDEKEAIAAARLAARERFGETGLHGAVSLVAAARSGLLGIGRKPGTYEIELVQPRYKVRFVFRSPVDPQ